MWWMVLAFSCALVGTGIFLLVRDILKSRKRPPNAVNAAAGLADGLAMQTGAPALDALQQQMDPVTAQTRKDEVTASRRVQPVVPPQASIQQSAPRTASPLGASAAPLPLNNPARLPAIEQHWERLKPDVDTAVAAVNDSLAGLSVLIAKPGEPTWSLHDRGFGDYRRVKVGGESVAWLRMELGADMCITANLRAHEARHESINRTAAIGRPLSAARIAPMLAECVAAVGAAAARLAPKPATAIVAPAPDRLQQIQVSVPQSAEPATVGPVEPVPPAPRPAEPKKQRAWTAWMNRPAPAEVRGAEGRGQTQPAQLTPAQASTVSAEAPASQLIDNALTLVNSAFAEAGAQLLPADEALAHEPVGSACRAFSIDVGGTSVGLMLIEPVGGRIDIAVGVTDMAQLDRALRHSQDLAGLTVHPLAESIATCAWPAIAAARRGV